MAVFLDGRAPVAVHDADRALKPASNQKILTAVAGIHALGIEHVYETTVSATAPLVGGSIDGDLVVRGSGDPNISGRFYDGDPTAIFRSWARGLKDAGLVRVTGDVVADDRFFDDVRMPPSWDIRQENSWYSAQVSALNLNDNCLDFTVTPGPRVGAPAVARWVPRSGYTKISGEVKTVSEGDTAVGLYRKHRTNEIRLAGKIPKTAGAVWEGHVTVDDPALFLVTVLVEVLREEGIAVAGAPRRVARGGLGADGGPGPDGGGVPDGGPGSGGGGGPDGGAGAGPEARSAPPAGPDAAPHLLVRHRSTLRRDLPIILKNSQNLHAESLLKAAGVKVAGEGSVAGGERAILAYLRSKGIDRGKLVVRDGSGLSHENLVTAGLLARVLREVRDEPYFEEFLGSLPAAGVDGKLRSRFRTRPHLRGRVLAKTGYIDGVWCLSGYVVAGDPAPGGAVLGGGAPGGEAPGGSAPGRKVGCFSVLVNANDQRTGTSGTKAKELQEAVAEAVYRALGTR